MINIKTLAVFALALAATAAISTKVLKISESQAAACTDASDNCGGGGN